MMDPKIEARAYRIWCFAQPLKWGVTLEEIASHLKLTKSQIAYCMAMKKWQGRLSKKGSDPEIALSGKFSRGLQDTYVGAALPIDRFMDENKTRMMDYD